MRPAILYLDTNVLLDMPRPEEYRFSGRRITLVVIPEVARELRGLSRSPDRGQAGGAMQAAAAIESMANRRGGAAGISIPRSSAVFRVPSLSSAGAGSADGPLVAKARAEQARDPKSLVVVVTRDRGLADRARAERVKTVLIYGQATASEIERGLAEHDSILDIDL